MDSADRVLLHWDGHDEVAVVIIENHDVVVARAGCSKESASLVGVDLSRFFDGRVAEVSAAGIARGPGGEGVG